MQSVEKAALALGSQSALARAFGLTPQAVQKWCKRGVVPANRVLKIEALTGISRNELRPDIYPPPVEPTTGDTNTVV